MNTEIKSEHLMIICGLCALFAGILNGFIGTGGGVILLLLLRGLYGKEKQKEAYASVILTVLPMSLISAFIYTSREPGLFTLSSPFLLPACAGGLLGAFLLGRLNTRVMSKIFGAMLLVSGIMTVVLK